MISATFVYIHYVFVWIYSPYMFTQRMYSATLLLARSQRTVYFQPLRIRTADIPANHHTRRHTTVCSSVPDKNRCLTRVNSSKCTCSHTTTLIFHYAPLRCSPQSLAASATTSEIKSTLTSGNASAIQLRILNPSLYPKTCKY